MANMANIPLKGLYHYAKMGATFEWDIINQDSG